MVALTDMPVQVVVGDRLRTTSVCVGTRFGARCDPPGSGGLAHMLEHLVMSAPTAVGSSFSEHVERRGGHTNAETGLETMLFYAQVDAADDDATCRALVDAVTGPRLSAETLASERETVLQEIAAAHADPSDVVQDLFLARIFPRHPLGRPVAGTREEVAALDIDTVRAGHGETFLSSPMAVVVVGPRVPACLAGRPGASTPPPLPAPQELAPVDSAPPVWADEFSWLCVGGRSPGASVRSLEYEVLAHLLGGSPSSLLYRKLRAEKGLAYMFQAWNRTYGEAGAWRVMAGTEPGNCDAVVAAVRETLELVAAGRVDAADVDAARRQARMQLVLEMESPLEHARLLARRWCAGHEAPPERALADFDEVTGEEVARAAQRLLDELVVVSAPQRTSP